ncbi:hypothetical protein SDC9_199762 [bioreactor metagenome]|uniref:Uncharacterized protein n=1 Tax=bioreactor metagenome TaxID=1076179 RepID=A0A645ILD4_9ZZZZ
MGGHRRRPRDDLVGEGAHEVFVRLDERLAFGPVDDEALGPRIKLRVGRKARAALADYPRPFYRL